VDNPTRVNSDSALDIAATSGALAVVKLLLVAGARVRWNTLYKVAEKHEWEVLYHLLLLRAIDVDVSMTYQNIFEEEEEWEATPLVGAVSTESANRAVKVCMPCTRGVTCLDR
jgi:hypothetical protein